MSRAIGGADAWTPEEMEVLRANPHLTAKQLAELLPGRNAASVGNKRWQQKEAREKPPVKNPGDYIETLSSYLVDEFDCMEVWAKWHGYAAWRELSRDSFGWVTLCCTAK